MDVNLHPDLLASSVANDAASAIESCVHCGFCLATCPTYLDTRDERDSPRGRIYLLREFLEGNSDGGTAQTHLDRCLSCNSCETTCPSGVEYGRIADAGRSLLEERGHRGWLDRLVRALLLTVVPYPRRFTPFLRIGQWLRPILPAGLQKAVPPRQTPIKTVPSKTYGDTVILLEGCVQRAATPATNAALRYLLEQLQVGVVETPRQGCCGALGTHLGAREAGREAMRRNIDAWWPAITAGATAIISSATGCASQLEDYGSALADDPAYAEKARRVSELSCDAAAYLLTHEAKLATCAPQDPAPRVALHIPCSQTHALGEKHTSAQLLRAVGATLVPTRDDHLCCGSAGSYSLLQPAMSRRLRTRKLDALTGEKPDEILTANIGCQLHLDQESPVKVRHWLEFLAEQVAP